MGLSQVIQAIRMVQSLPNLSSPSVAPNLLDHISDAKMFSNTWLQVRAHNLSHAIQSVNYMANNWEIYKLQIDHLENDPANKIQIKSILQRANSQAKDSKQELDSLPDEIANDTQKVASLSGDLTSDVIKIQSKIEGDKQAIQSLLTQIAAAQAKINDYHSRDWLWAIPVAGWLERGIESLVDNITGYQQQIAELSREDNILTADVSELGAIAGCVSAWMEAMQILTFAMGSLGSGVNAVESNLSNTIALIEDMDANIFSIWIQAQVKSTDDNIQHLSILVKTLNG